MRNSILLGLIVILTALICAQMQTIAFADDELIGTWEVVTWVNGGQNQPDNVGQQFVFDFDTINPVLSAEEFDETIPLSEEFDEPLWNYVVDTEATPHTKVVYRFGNIMRLPRLRLGAGEGPRMRIEPVACKR